MALTQELSVQTNLTIFRLHREGKLVDPLFEKDGVSEATFTFKDSKGKSVTIPWERVKKEGVELLMTQDHFQAMEAQRSNATDTEKKRWEAFREKYHHYGLDDHRTILGAAYKGKIGSDLDKLYAIGEMFDKGLIVNDQRAYGKDQTLFAEFLVSAYEEDPLRLDWSEIESRPADQLLAYVTSERTQYLEALKETVIDEAKLEEINGWMKDLGLPTRFRLATYGGEAYGVVAQNGKPQIAAVRRKDEWIIDGRYGRSDGLKDGYTLEQAVVLIALKQKVITKIPKDLVIDSFHEDGGRIDHNEKWDTVVLTKDELKDYVVEPYNLSIDIIVSYLNSMKGGKY